MTPTHTPVYLDDFIAQTLTQICQGVLKARASVEPHGADVAVMSAGDEGPLPIDRLVRPVEFDVAVDIADTTTSTGRIGITTIIEGTKTSGSSRSSASRVKFTIPLLLPMSAQDERILSRIDRETNPAGDSP